VIRVVGCLPTSLIELNWRFMRAAHHFGNTRKLRLACMSSFLAEKLDRFQRQVDSSRMKKRITLPKAFTSMSSRAGCASQILTTWLLTGTSESVLTTWVESVDDNLRQWLFGVRPRGLDRCLTGSVKPAWHARSPVALPPLELVTLELSEHVPAQD
jgi:hypothetical protein